MVYTHTAQHYKLVYVINYTHKYTTLDTEYKLQRTSYIRHTLHTIHILNTCDLYIYLKVARVPGPSGVPLPLPEHLPALPRTTYSISRVKCI